MKRPPLTRRPNFSSTAAIPVSIEITLEPDISVQIGRIESFFLHFGHIAGVHTGVFQGVQEVKRNIVIPDLMEGADKFGGDTGVVNGVEVVEIEIRVAETAKAFGEFRSDPPTL